MGASRVSETAEINSSGVSLSRSQLQVSVAALACDNVLPPQSRTPSLYKELPIFAWQARTPHQLLQMAVLKDVDTIGHLDAAHVVLARLGQGDRTVGDFGRKQYGDQDGDKLEVTGAKSGTS